MQNDRIKKTFELISSVNGKDILDIGCSEGIHDKSLSDMGYNVTGIDICQRAIDIAKELENDHLKFICGDVLKVDLPPKSFDIILFIETIEHIDNPSDYLERIHYLLKDDGYLIISTPNSQGLCNTLYNLKHFFDFPKLVEEKYDVETEKGHIASYDKITLYRLLYINGFKLDKFVESFKFHPKIYQSLIMRLKKINKI